MSADLRRTRRGAQIRARVLGRQSAQQVRQTDHVRAGRKGRLIAAPYAGAPSRPFPPADPDMQLSYVNIFARDIEALSQFYKDVFGFEDIPEIRSPIFVGLKTGLTCLGFN